MNTRSEIKKLTLFAIAAAPAIVVGFVGPQYWVSFLVGTASFIIFSVVYNRFYDNS